MFSPAIFGEKGSKKLIQKRKLKIASYKFAIVDLGTNSVRLDVYRVNGKKIIRTHRDKTMIRLGDGVFKTGQLSAEGMVRALRAFSGYKRLLHALRVEKVIAFGTSALRSSKNAKDFVAEVKKRTGIQIRIISGREEAQLIARGIMSNIVSPKGYYVLIDIGGGSTEVSICLRKKIVSCQSFKLGANRLQQTFLKTIPPVFKKGTLHPVLALRQHLKTELYPLAASVEKYPIKLAIGSSGTIRTVSKILKRSGRNGQPISRTHLSALVAELQVMSREQIKATPGLEPKRVDLILSGAILLEEILYALKLNEVTVTELALRDGILQKELESKLTARANIRTKGML